MNWRQRLFLALLWFTFVGLWFRVYYISTWTDVTNAGVYLVSILSAYGLLVTFWVAHNISLYRRKGPRRNVRFLNHVPTHDELRSYIVAKTDLKKTQEISITVVDGRKVFKDRVTAEKELASA